MHDCTHVQCQSKLNYVRAKSPTMEKESQLVVNMSVCHLSEFRRAHDDFSSLAVVTAPFFGLTTVC